MAWGIAMATAILTYLKPSLGNESTFDPKHYATESTNLQKRSYHIFELKIK